jgi:acyl carrier protein
MNRGAPTRPPVKTLERTSKGDGRVSEASLFDRVVKHMGEYLEMDVSHLDPNARIATAIPGIDSMKIFEMVLYLEDCFEVEFEEKVMEKIDTLSELVSYIDSKLAAKAVEAQ